jgi:hypothetical protein
VSQVNSTIISWKAEDNFCITRRISIGTEGIRRVCIAERRGRAVRTLLRPARCRKSNTAPEESALREAVYRSMSLGRVFLWLFLLTPLISGLKIAYPNYKLLLPRRLVGLIPWKIQTSKLKRTGDGLANDLKLKEISAPTSSLFISASTNSRNSRILQVWHFVLNLS